MNRSGPHFLAFFAAASFLACEIFGFLCVAENAMSQNQTPDTAQAAKSGVAESASGAQAGDPLRLLPSRVSSLLNGFFEKMQEAKIDAAYAALLDGSKINARKEDVASLHEHARKAIAEYGAIRAFDVLESRFAGQNLLRVTALSVGADYPLRWRFYFYKGGQDWRLLDLRVDDGLSGMFDPSAEDGGAATVVPEAADSAERSEEGP